MKESGERKVLSAAVLVMQPLYGHWPLGSIEAKSDGNGGLKMATKREIAKGAPQASAHLQCSDTLQRGIDE